VERGTYPAKRSIADDAFGPTEYDVNRGSEWGRQPHKVIPKRDKRHRLVWTSRMHILQQALQEMSLRGAASRFPDHKEVLVKANRIEGNERAYCFTARPVQPILTKAPLASGALPPRKVGKHRRIRMEDVMAYKSCIDRDREAVLDQLVAETQQDGMGYSRP
jgi:hypothetical protein